MSSFLCLARTTTAERQACLMGLIFMLLFSAFYVLQAFLPKLDGQKTASNVLATLYATFTAGCFAAPAITNLWKPRTTMGVGILGYVVFVVCNLVFELRRNLPGDGGGALLVAGGAILGVGASLLWTAQGRLMLEWSEDGSDAGRLFAIFWALFNVSGILGGFLAFGYFSEPHAPSTQLYVIFLVLMSVSAASVLLLSPGPAAAAAADDEGDVAADGSSSPPNVLAAPSPSSICPSAFAEAGATLRLFARPRMLLLALLFWYTGFNQPYQLDTYGRRFTKRAMGIEALLFYAAEIVGALLAGFMLDSSSRPRRAAKHQLALWAAATSAAYACALTSGPPPDGCPEAASSCLKLLDADSVLPTLAFILWGFSDSQIQAFSYWLLRQLHDDGPEQARAIGFYKMLQSLGWCVGFAIMPTSRVPAEVQMWLTVGSAAFGGALALVPISRLREGVRSGKHGSADVPAARSPMNSTPLLGDAPASALDRQAPA